MVYELVSGVVHVVEVGLIKIGDRLIRVIVGPLGDPFWISVRLPHLIQTPNRGNVIHFVSRVGVV